MIAGVPQQPQGDTRTVPAAPRCVHNRGWTRGGSPGAQRWLQATDFRLLDWGQHGERCGTAAGPVHMGEDFPGRVVAGTL
ncbi:hypothetical protein GCM10010103_09900 [Streptomyces paradoxus]